MRWILALAAGAIFLALVARRARSRDARPCPCCGRFVPAGELEFAYRLPDEIRALRETERWAGVDASSDFVRLDDRRFVRCLLPVPVGGGDEFCFGVWTEVDGATFDRVRRVWNVPAGYRELRFEGLLANPVRFGSVEIEPAPVELATSDPSQRPRIATSPSPALERLLRKGWTRREHHRLAAQVFGDG